MGRVAIRAEYKTENIFNEGYICIDGDVIEGIFGLDYMKITMLKDCFTLQLHETIYLPINGVVIGGIRIINYTSHNIYYPEITCPEQYILFSKADNMSLSLLELEHCQSVIRDVYERLEKIRPNKTGAV